MSSRTAVLCLVLILVNRLSGLVLPSSTKYLVDDVIRGARADFLWTLLGAVAAAVTIQAATSFLLTRLLSVEAQLLIAQLRAEVQRHVLRLPVRSFDDTKTGELVSRIMDDVEGVRNLVGTGLVTLYFLIEFSTSAASDLSRFTEQRSATSPPKQLPQNASATAFSSRWFPIRWVSTCRRSHSAWR